MNSIDRRDFTKHTLGSLLAYSAARNDLQSRRARQGGQPIAAKWLGELNDRSQSLKGAKLTQLQWQTEIEKAIQARQLARVVDLRRFQNN